jgi:hypothetical protein
MEFIEKLSRSEMKIIKGGNPCARGCLGLYGGYYEECDQTYPPSTDGRMACFTEVRDLNRACIDHCFMVR